MIEKTIERRQKRMIKNWESATHSRARKQAYTNELENKVSRLEEENERLRKRKVRSLSSHFKCIYIGCKGNLFAKRREIIMLKKTKSKTMKITSVNSLGG
uniref:BZIP domain-containing protein n=1 Tax=Vitis vinifera TaxID=29760 RepID=F6H993_VITVI